MEDKTMAKIMLQLGAEEISALQTGVVVEMYPSVVLRSGKTSGSKRRKYHAEFSEAERKTISALHRLFYWWHIGGTRWVGHRLQYGGGIPETYTMAPRTLVLINRVVGFFGTL